MRRAMQILLAAASLVTCWMGMQSVHELGHVIGAIATGAEVTNVALHPLGISRTDVVESRHPRIVVWSGPLLGVLIPATLWLAIYCLCPRVEPLFRFFLGFCLVANGLYLGVGSIEGIGDCGDLLHLGTPVWYLWLYAFLTVPAGFYLWNQLGSHFGIRKLKGPIDPAMVSTATVLAVALIILGLWVGV